MPRNYILSEDPRYDVVKLRPIQPGDEYLLLNKNTGTLTKIGPQEMQTLFVHCIDDVKDILDGVIRKNIALDYSEYVDYLIKSKLQELGIWLEGMIASRMLVRYRGSCEILPNEANPGDCYCMGDKYYLRLPDMTWEQLVTQENLEKILENYFTKEELTAKIQEVQAEIAGLSSYIDSRASELSASLERYITKEEALAKLSEYETQIGIYRETYETQMDRLQSSWNEEMAALSAWRDEQQTTVDASIQRVEELQAQHSKQVEQISSFMAEKQLEISECNDQISGILVEFSDLQTLTSGLVQNLSNYEQLFSQMQQKIDELTAKLDELQKFDQSILEL